MALIGAGGPQEMYAALLSFSLVLLLMSAYYILRPLRDALASDWLDAELSWLWTLTFLLSFAAVSLYGAAVSRLTLRRLVPLVYGFFAASFVLFYLGMQAVAERTLLDKAFYVWLSLFSLFHISVFWSLMAELFSREQALRLFAFIGAGASVGGIIGPALATLLVRDLGSDTLMLLAVCLLLCALPLVLWVQRLRPSARDHGTAAAAPGRIGGSPLAGFSLFLRSRYLLGIGLFIFLYTAISSFVYFELKNLLAAYGSDARASIWAGMDLAVNSLTLLIAIFATGRIARYCGLPFTLALVPVLVGGGMLVLAAAPLVSVAVAVQVARRAGNYAVSRPAREMLFTAVDRETRFKAKQVIDILVYRGGDMINAWLFTALTQGLQLGLAPVAVIGAGIALLWAATGIGLGRRFNKLAVAPVK